MTIFDTRNALESMTVLVDTREQETRAFHRRMDSMPCTWRKQKLDSGDYSCEFTMPNGEVVCLADRVVVERKMSADEICANYTRGRDRFIREFDRLKEKGVRPYLLIENTSWDDIDKHRYRSLMRPEALVASLKAWEARYGTHILFCSSGLSGMLIYKTLYYELKEMLESGDFDELDSGGD